MKQIEHKPKGKTVKRDWGAWECPEIKNDEHGEPLFWCEKCGKYDGEIHLHGVIAPTAKKGEGLS